MKTLRLFALLCLSAAPAAPLPLSAQDEADQSLTYQRFPSRFDTDNPLRPDSSLLLRFSEPVNPGEVERFFQFYDQNGEQFAPLRARRPEAEEVEALARQSFEEVSAEHFVVIRPASEFALGGNWFLNARQGFSNSAGTHRLVESRLDPIGHLFPFEIGEISTENRFDEPLRIEVRHNKPKLHSDFDAAKLAEFISVSPEVENFKVDSDWRKFVLDGDFSYGVEYRVTVRDGIVANDTTQLAQVFRAAASFEPRPGFVTFPAFRTTQNASGHRRFDIQTGNLTGLRTRVKSLDGDDLIVAMREYDDKYQGWGEKEALAFASIPGATIHDQFHDATADLDRTATVSLDWDELTGGTATGAYYLCAEGSSSTRDNHRVGAHSLVQLTDIGLAWKQSAESTLIYAFSLKSGTPLPDLQLRLVDGNAAPVLETRTDASGNATLAGEDYRDHLESPLFLDARKGNDRHAIRFHGELHSLGLWSFSINQRWDDFREGERRTLIFTDRNVYKPGEEVKFKAISRFVDTDRLLGAGKGEAVLRVYDSRRRKLIERDISFNESGTFDDFFTLPAAGMGWHSLEIDFNPVDSEDHPDWRLISSHGFQVEDYRVNTFEINIESEREYTQAESIEIPLSATYYMGKPLSQAELQWNLYAHSEFPRPRGFDEFRFGDVTRPYQTHSNDGTATLTSTGSATVKVALPEESANPGPRRVNLTAQVTDANQQTISNSTRFIVHSSDFYLGMREPEGVHRAGDTATFSLAAVTSGGQAHTAPVPTTVLVEKEFWNTVKVMGADGRFTHRNDRRLETVSEESFTLETEVDPATGLTRAVPRELTFAEAGDYLITLTARDDQGRPVLTRVRFTVIGATEPSWSWYDVIRIDLTPDKDSYRIGETARLLARSPVFGHALLTTERGGVRSTRALEITDYETILEIPVEEGDAPNVFASLLIVRGSEDSPHVHTSADYRLGYCQLSVEDPASRLEVVIDSGEAPSYQPGEEVTVSALVRDAKGGPVSGAEVTLFAVDEGVLSLTAHPTPDPHSVFHEEFPLAVSTGQSLSDLLPENPLEQDFGNKGYVIGGGGAPGLDPDRVRKDFKALAFWEPTMHTGEDGVVTATFEAPDNLTTFRIMAVVAEGNRFGHAEAPVLINKPLIIEPALPGFTNVTDQIDVTAVLHNTTDRRQEVVVNVRLDEHAIFLHEIGDAIPTSLAGTAEETQRTAKAFLEPGSTETLSFPIALTSVGEAKWTWEVRSLTEERLRDATESTIAVGYPLPLLRETHSFTLKEGDSFEEALHAVAPRLLKGEGSITVTLSNSRLVEAADGLDYLLQYPYGCLEQTTSSLIPWLMTHQLRPVLPQLEQSDEQIAATITGGIQKILSMQTNDGGLGYWPGSHQSELWASAYGGLALLLASQQGIEVPEEQALALWDYLAKNLRETSELGSPYELSQRCLAVYTLALAGINESSYHEVLYEKRGQLSGEARSLLALAMVESGGQIPERIETLLSPDEKVPVAEVSWYRQPYVASTRLLAQLRQDPKSERIDGLLNDLLKLREARRGWGNTYSNAWSLIALAAYGDSVKDSLAANEVAVRFGDREETLSFPAEPGNGSLSFAFDGEVDRDALRLAPSQSAPIYATLTVETRPELMPVEPENRGFAISRRYEKVEIDGSISALDDPRVGDLVLVTLDINLPNERESYLAIDDALPAIFEAVNPDFKSQATQRVNAESRVRTLRPNHREIRKDRVLFFADRVLGAGDYSLQYLARIVAPGEVTTPPAKIEAMYEPQRFGLSGTGRISAGPLLQQPARVAAR